MPDDRRAWHRGGACLFIVNLLRRGRTTCPRETSVCRGPWGPPRTCGAEEVGELLAGSVRVGEEEVIRDS